MKVKDKRINGHWDIRNQTDQTPELGIIILTTYLWIQRSSLVSWLNSKGSRMNCLIMKDEYYLFPD